MLSLSLSFSHSLIFPSAHLFFCFFCFPSLFFPFPLFSILLLTARIFTPFHVYIFSFHPSLTSLLLLLHFSFQITSHPLLVNSDLYDYNVFFHQSFISYKIHVLNSYHPISPILLPLFRLPLPLNLLLYDVFFHQPFLTYKIHVLNPYHPISPILLLLPLSLAS